MQESSAAAVTESASIDPLHVDDRLESVSTHVLVEEDHVLRLRELSKKTRVAQSEYLREAVDDLLEKYHSEADKAER